MWTNVGLELLFFSGVAALGFTVYFHNRSVNTMGTFGSIRANGANFSLFDSNKMVVGTYARRRDAVRGANRRGIALNG